MLLPTKGLSVDRALLNIGVEVIDIAKRNISMSESELWDAYQKRIAKWDDTPLVTFDWFLLALTTLFALGIVKRDQFGRLEMTHVSS